jgi:hypothetical protein
MKSLKADVKKKPGTLEPIPPKKTEHLLPSKRPPPKAAVPPTSAPGLKIAIAPQAAASKKSAGYRLPSLLLGSHPQGPQIVLAPSSPMPDSPSHEHQSSVDSPVLTHSHSSNCDSNGPSPLVKSLSGANLRSGSPPDLAPGNNGSFALSIDGGGEGDGTASPALSGPPYRLSSLSSIHKAVAERSNVDEKIAVAGEKTPASGPAAPVGGRRLSVPGPKPSAAAAARRGPRRKSSQQIQSEAARKILFWYRAAGMRRKIKFLVQFVRKFVDIQETARRRRISNIVRRIGKFVAEKVHAMRIRREAASQNYVVSGHATRIQRFLWAYCSRAIVGSARRQTMIRSVDVISSIWLTSPLYRRLRLLEEFEELYVLLKQEAVERRELARKWLSGAIEIKSSFSATHANLFVSKVLFRERSGCAAVDETDEEDSLYSPMAKSRPDSPKKRGGFAGSRRHLATRNSSRAGSNMGSRSVSPAMSGEMRSDGSAVRRGMRSMSTTSELEAERALLTPLWIDHLHKQDPHEAHLDKVDHEFFHPDRTFIVPNPSLKRKISVSATVIGGFWESWFLQLDGTNVFSHQGNHTRGTLSATASGAGRTSASCDLSIRRNRARCASMCESVQFINSTCEKSKVGRNKKSDSPDVSFVTQQMPKTGFYSTDFILSQSHAMNLELDVEKVLIQERTTRQRIEGNCHRLVKDILERMLTERQRELHDLLPNSPPGKKKAAETVAAPAPQLRTKRQSLVAMQALCV